MEATLGGASPPTQVDIVWTLEGAFDMATQTASINYFEGADCSGGEIMPPTGMALGTATAAAVSAIDGATMVTLTNTIIAIADDIDPTTTMMVGGGQDKLRTYEYCVRLTIATTSTGTIVDFLEVGITVEATLENSVLTLNGMIDSLANDPTSQGPLAVTYTASMFVCNNADTELTNDEDRDVLEGSTVRICVLSDSHPTVNIASVTSISCTATFDDMSTVGATDLTLDDTCANAEVCGFDVVLPREFYVNPNTNIATGSTVDCTSALVLDIPDGSIRRELSTARALESTTVEAFTTIYAVEEKDAPADSNECACSGFFFVICFVIRCMFNFI